MSSFTAEVLSFVSNLVKSENMVPKIYVMPNINESCSAVLRNRGNKGEVSLFLIENVEPQPAKKRRTTVDNEQNTIDLRSPGRCEEGSETMMFDEALPKRPAPLYSVLVRQHIGLA
ncbi:uncharacterized protein LOC119568412 [Penaeus monodon]|uniref:uncharacterized protein LOC119568412 n=1 Tax=Penaeus monodon TaxID=6687 RepID=UPI0018A7C49C|nr:uncharacterized protein LOC119568412 [Penaeus monodon]